MMSSNYKFNYDIAFSRNNGLLSESEQKMIKNLKVGMAGLGGMGGGHAMCLARMGFSQFHLADFDQFELANFNRQLGANISTIGLSKSLVLKSQLLDINPEAEIHLFQQGITKNNINQFLEDVDIVIDAIDFFQIEIRKLLYKTAKSQNIPVVFAAPLGYSATMIAFTPHSMSFEDYYKIYDDTSYFDSLVNLIAGISPGGLHWSYLDITPEDIFNKRGPSISLACFLGNSLVAMETLAILSKKRKPLIAPYSIQVDLLKGVYKKSNLLFGNASLLQWLKRKMIAHKFAPYRAQIESLNNNSQSSNHKDSQLKIV